MLKGFYINLDERIDRRDHFESNVKTTDFFKHISRFPAISHSIGAIGCGMSHLSALKRGLELYNDETYICIFEDDFIILNDSNMNTFITDFLKIELCDAWDIIVLTPRGTTVHTNVDEEMTAANFKKIDNNQTATGYIIKQSMIPILIQNMEEAINNLLLGENYDTFAIDQYWKKLQTKYNFYYSSHIFGGQLIGWSNNENRFVDYNERFMNQHLF